MLAEVKRAQIRKRRQRIRRRLSGTGDRPRLSVHRSHLHLYAQAVDDIAERTLCFSSTLSSELRKSGRKSWGSIDAAKEFGAFAAAELKKKKITRIVFDRSGLPYHGRIKAFADALRENGIQF